MPGDAKNSHRVKQVVSYYQSGTQKEKTVFSYEGENLIMITEFNSDFNGNWIKNKKIEISYSGSNATATESKFSTGNNNWEINHKMEYIIDNGQITEELIYYSLDNQWDAYGKYTYQYSGTQLIATQSYGKKKKNENLIQNEKSEYIYDNKKLIESIGYYNYKINDWVPDIKITYSFSGSNLNEFVVYNNSKVPNDWIKAFKCENTYSGNNMTKSGYWYWNTEINDWDNETYRTSIYSYDSNGYFIEENYENEKTTIEYEEGNGNATLFYYYPIELVFDAPELKSISINKQNTPYYKRMYRGM